MNRRFLSAQEICGMLGISISTLDRMVVIGDFPKAEFRYGRGIRRWRENTVEIWLARQARTNNTNRRS